MTRSPVGSVRIDCRWIGDWSARSGATVGLMRPEAVARVRMAMMKGARPLPLWMTDGMAAMTRMMCATTA
jgi:hypothetical protein